MLLAFDNTDGPGGGCTTHAAFHVLLALPDLALRGLPRLVRLNPNVPWKTRGNGAVVIPLGRPEGPQVRVGELRGREVLAFPEGRPAAPTPEVLDRAWAALEGLAQKEAMPGLVLCAEAPPSALYWHAVRTFVPPTEAKAACAELALPHRAAGDGRGLVGSLAAAAWPGPPSSFEVIAYREPQRWGRARELDPAPLMGLDAAGHGTTFHTVDPVARKLACVPRTPDPVLCGLRGRDPERLVAAAIPALARAAREPVDGWLLWASNQASGDHISPVHAVAEAPAMGTVQVEAEVTAPANRRQGGHAFVPLRDAAGLAFEAVAFEPTHAFRDVLSALLPGDRVVVVGAFSDGLVKLEKLRIVAPVSHRQKQNPACPDCGRRMRSKGPSTGFRCSGCKKRLPPSAMEWLESPRGVTTAWHEPPVMARRHLHRPAAWEPAPGAD
jgi:tRNA(Ile2)-agmatinylcytidine synthase